MYYKQYCTIYYFLCCFSFFIAFALYVEINDNYVFIDVEYRKALAEGEMDVAYARLMFLGAAGVGKTSFKRSLMKEPYDPHINSTIVSDVHSLRPIGREWQKIRS